MNIKIKIFNLKGNQFQWGDFVPYGNMKLVKIW